VLKILPSTNHRAYDSRPLTHVKNQVTSSLTGKRLIRLESQSQNRSKVMKTKLAKSLVLVILLGGLLASTSVAATVATAAVTPAITVPGGKVFIHTSVGNLTVTNQAVSVALDVTNPGTCVTGHLPSHAGALAFSLRPSETRLADLSLDIPASTCSGTYGVTIVVKNSAGTVLATHTAKFTVTIP
jgi:hypothetical protein